MSVTAIEIVSALRILSQAALTAEQIKVLLGSEEISEESVEAALNSTDSAIENARNNNGD